MNINIQSLKFKADKKLEEFVTEKVEKVASFAQRVIGAEVVLKLEKDEDRENKVVDLRLEIPGHDLFASKQAKTFEEACVEACEAIRGQLMKLKK